MLLPFVWLAETGYTYEVTMRVTDAKNKTATVRFRVQVLGSKARADVLEGDKELKAGDYTITTDEGFTTASVSPKNKTIEWASFEKSMKEIQKEKGLNGSDFQSAWSSPTQDQRVLTRRFKLTYRELIFTQKIAVAENHTFTLAAPSATGPHFNPVVNALLLDLSSFALKFPEAVKEGPKGLVPTGFVTKASLDLKAKVGKKDEGSHIELETTAPIPSTVPESAFTLPSGYKTKG